jgi:putative iron-regulated protein
MRLSAQCALRGFALLVAASVAPAVLAQAPAEAEVLETYADIALAGYEDSLTTAQALDEAVDALIAEPSENTLEAARDAWLAARLPYQQTEAFRFGNPIDYVDAGYGTESDSNALYVANIIANPQITIDGVAVDATQITPALLQDELQEAAGVESNVATGYHAIEFLLWGQDLNGTEAGAGERPATDYSTDAHAERRGAYLKAASTLLVSDLEEMVDNWHEGGAAREALPGLGLSAILTGMGSLSFGELAGERMQLGLLLHDPEEEHDCFSDNTHVSHLQDALGIQNVYLGEYVRVDGTTVSGPSLSDVIAAEDPALDEEIRGLLGDTLARMQVMADRVEAGEAYDQQIGEGNAEGNAIVQAAIDGLIAQTRGFERAIALLDLEDVTIEDSDSLSNPDAVFE